MGTRRDLRPRHRTAEAGAPGFRGERLELLIAEELNSILDGEVSDFRLEGTRITMVEMSKDGSRARSWFAVPPDSELGPREIDAALERATGFFRRRLCEALLLKRMPELTFRHDPSAWSWPDDLDQLGDGKGDT
jgi:ribosome-binding factor A